MLNFIVWEKSSLQTTAFTLQAAAKLFSASPKMSFLIYKFMCNTSYFFFLGHFFYKIEMCKYFWTLGEEEFLFLFKGLYHINSFPDFPEKIVTCHYISKSHHIYQNHFGTHHIKKKLTSQWLMIRDTKLSALKLEEERWGSNSAKSLRVVLSK